MSDRATLLAPTRLTHKAAQVDMNGRVSALCFMAVRPINMKRATWTLRDEAVTCPKCRGWIIRNAALRARAAEDKP